MKKEMYNNYKKNPEKPQAPQNYSYYSRVLEKPFDSLAELAKAEAAHYDKLKAKEDAAAQKKADAKKVEDAFKALNAARKAYKINLLALTERYSKDLQEMKAAFEQNKHDEQRALSDAESAYSAALKEFTDKHPEGYHLTLKDGDFETTISGGNVNCGNTYSCAAQETNPTKSNVTVVDDLLDLVFGNYFGF